MNRIKQIGKNVWQRTAFWRSGKGLVILAVLFIGLRLLVIQLERPAHFKEITAAYGADSLFYGVPQLSHSGNQFTFVKTSSKGYALYLYDTAGKQKEMICEENGLNRQHDTPDINAMPWSLDDNSFLYTIDDKLMLYSLENKIPVPLLTIETNSITDIIWVNPTAFAFITHGTNLFAVQQQASGQWKQHQIWHGGSRLTSLADIDDNSVAWLENNLICHANLEQNLVDTTNLIAGIQVTNVVAPPTNGLSLWLDASMLHQSNQSTVTELRDLSPNHYNAFPNGAAPTYNASNSANALFGKGTIHFALLGSITNGTGLATRAIPGLVSNAPRSVIVVMRHDLDRSMMVSMGDTKTKGSLFAVEFTNYLYLPTGWGADNKIKMDSTNWNILEAIYDGKNQEGFVGGIRRGIAHAKLNTSIKEVEIGMRTATSGTNAKAAEGDFAELLIYNHALNAKQRGQIEDYLGGKWFGLKPKHLPEQNPFVWFDPKVDGLTGLSYSKKTGKLLVSGVQAGHGIVWQFDSESGSFEPIAKAASFSDVQWVDDKEWAGIRRDPGHTAIVTADASDDETRILPEANFRWFQTTTDGRKILALGTVNNEPSAGLWEYDITAKKLQSIASYSDYPSDYAKDVVPFDQRIKTAQGTNLVAAIFPPLNFNPHKKYPLVIGDTRFTVAVNGVHGRQWVPCVAAGGAYVVIVERRGWSVGIENWGKDVTAAYDSLKHDLKIDTSQVYLFGSSAETVYMNSVLTNSPGLWKGVILLNPGGLPDLSNVPLLQQRPKILISAGGDENEEERLKKYQQDALRDGVRVEYVIHPGEGHHIVGNASQLARTEAIMHFIFEE